eukprot:TRINITY_DN5733_c0_g1_i1.p1 TRINITY_DN5733_c0_g1~~TRINITY_DN5733_c0_g1_i1.p1  ORF type:complete len:541 (-),score=133.05 TRINITY_DN5733_c0_g1_i1:61-1629(-)
MLRLLLLFACCVHLSDASGDLLLRPTKTGTEVAVILLQGAQITTEQYVPLGQALQKASQMKLWVSIPDSPLDVVEPAVINSVVTRAISNLTAEGFKGKTFFAGHSLGGAMLQDWVFSNSDKGVGQILMGASLQRKYRNKTFPLPTLAAAGELDGLYRITRMAEEYYNRQKELQRFPVVVIKGMDHMQWATGKVPLLVSKEDLQPEITNSAALTAGSTIIANFIADVLGSSSAKAAVAEQVSSTKNLIQPIITAYLLEGARYWNDPQQKGGPAEDCPKGGCSGPGSQWTPKAQALIGDQANLTKEGWKLSISSQFVQLSAMPPLGEFHLPHLNHSASNPREITVTTFSQESWDKLDSLDTGATYTSAIEIAAKMMARQCILIKGANHSKSDTPFSVDDPNFCALSNKMAYDWALKNAGAATAARFAKLGQPYVFGDDQKKSGGPFWIDTLLQFKEKTENGEKVMEVSSPMMKTSIDFPKVPGLPDPSCYHYCKLLSPARATEWIYVDGLRLKDTIKPSTISLN